MTWTGVAGAAADGATPPPDVTLPGQPIGRFGLPDEVASMVCHLALDDGGFVTGAAIPVDGGYTAG